MSKIRQPVAGLRKTAAEISANAAAEKARKAASKKALKAAKTPTPESAPANPASTQADEAARTQRKAQEHEAYLQALRIDAQAMGCETEEAIEAYIADQIKPAAGTDKPRYTGSMLILRTAALRYVKGANGNPHTTDDLAFTLEALNRAQVVTVLIAAMKLESNPYLHLNPGQQSMNLRNKARGMFKAGTLTLAEVQAAIERAARHPE